MPATQASQVDSAGDTQASSQAIARLRFAIKTALSLTLAYLIPIAMGWPQPQTAAITVMLIAATGNLSESLQKGVMRVLGTVAGAIIGLSLSITVLEFHRGAAARTRSRGESYPVALWTLFGRNRRRYGGYIIHLGVRGTEDRHLTPGVRPALVAGIDICRASVARRVARTAILPERPDHHRVAIDR